MNEALIAVGPESDLNDTQKYLENKLMDNCQKVDFQVLRLSENPKEF